MLKELESYKSVIPIQTYKTIKGQVLAGDIKGARKGLDKVIKGQECFAYKNKRCIALTVTKCEGLNCSFYKTKEEAEASRNKARERIMSLDKEKRDHIIETYRLEV